MASASTSLSHSNSNGISFSEEDQIPPPSPPPPTPCACNHSLTPGQTDAFLSHLLTRLSPTLTPNLPLRPKLKPLAPPVISLRQPNKQLLLSAAAELGLFHLSDHDIPSHLHETYLQNYTSNLVVSLGCRESDDRGHIHMFESNSGDEFAREMKRVGLKVLELLFEERERDFRTEARCLMCVSPSKMKNSMEKGNSDCCVVGLTYEGKGREEPRVVVDVDVDVDDSDEWVPVKAQEEAVLVTIGNVAQVWSNGRFRKVRSLPQESPSSLHRSVGPGNVLVTLLVTVPEEATVSTS